MGYLLGLWWFTVVVADCRAESCVMFDDIQERRREYVESVCPPSPTGQKTKKKK